MSGQHRVSYEWTVEKADADGDIQDVVHCDSLEAARVEAAYLEHYAKAEIALVRDVGNQIDGLIERGWAYLDADGRLPSHFDDHSAVPKRFMK